MEQKNRINPASNPTSNERKPRPAGASIPRPLKKKAINLNVFNLVSHWMQVQNYVISVLGESKLAREKLKDIALTNYRLGLYHLANGKMREAAFRFKFVCRLKPDSYPMAYYHWGRIELTGYPTFKTYFQIIWYNFLGKELPILGDKPKAIALFKKALSLKPDMVEARFMLDSIYHPDTITAIPISFTKEIFEGNTDVYLREYIEGLRYVGHRLLVNALEEILANNTQRYNILDIGCGTGLCGAELRKRMVAKALDGIDIAKSMAEYCKTIKMYDEPVYDTLINDNFITHLQQTGQTYDIITAAAVFNYIGQLDDALSACKKGLKQKGLLLFSFQPNTETNTDILFNNDLYTFMHRQSYIESQLKTLGFTIVNITEGTLYDECPAIQIIAQKD